MAAPLPTIDIRGLDPAQIKELNRELLQLSNIEPKVRLNIKQLGGAFGRLNAALRKGAENTILLAQLSPDESIRKLSVQMEDSLLSTLSFLERSAYRAKQQIKIESQILTDTEKQRMQSLTDISNEKKDIEERTKEQIRTIEEEILNIRSQTSTKTKQQIKQEVDILKERQRVLESTFDSEMKRLSMEEKSVISSMTVSDKIQNNFRTLLERFSDAMTDEQREIYAQRIQGQMDGEKASLKLLKERYEQEKSIVREETSKLSTLTGQEYDKKDSELKIRRQTISTLDKEIKSLEQGTKLREESFKKSIAQYKSGISGFFGEAVSKSFTGGLLGALRGEGFGDFFGNVFKSSIERTGLFEKTLPKFLGGGNVGAFLFGSQSDEARKASAKVTEEIKTIGPVISTLETLINKQTEAIMNVQTFASQGAAGAAGAAGQVQVVPGAAGAAGQVVSTTTTMTADAITDMMRSVESTKSSLEVLKSTLDSVISSEERRIDTTNVTSISEAARSQKTDETTVEEAKRKEETASLTSAKELLNQTVKTVEQSLESMKVRVDSVLSQTNIATTTTATENTRSIQEGFSNILSVVNRASESMERLKTVSEEIGVANTSTIDSLNKINESVSSVVSTMETLKSNVETVNLSYQNQVSISDATSEKSSVSLITMKNSVDSVRDSLEILKAVTDTAILWEEKKQQTTEATSSVEENRATQTSRVIDVKNVLIETMRTLERSLNTMKSGVESVSVSTRIASSETNQSTLATQNTITSEEQKSLLSDSIRESMRDTQTSFDKLKTATETVVSSQDRLSLESLRDVQEQVNAFSSNMIEVSSAVERVNLTTQESLVSKEREVSVVTSSTETFSRISDSIESLKNSIDILKIITDTETTASASSIEAIQNIENSLNSAEIVFSKLSEENERTRVSSETASKSLLEVSNSLDIAKQSIESLKSSTLISSEEAAGSVTTERIVSSMERTVEDTRSAIENLKSNIQSTNLKIAQESSTLSKETESKEMYDLEEKKEATLLSAESEDIKISIVDLVRRVEELGLTTPSTLSANAAIERLTQEATQPGSIFTHDMSSENVLKNIFDLLQRWFDAEQTMAVESRDKEEVSSTLEKQSTESLKEISETQSDSLEIQKKEEKTKAEKGSGFSFKKMMFSFGAAVSTGWKFIKGVFTFFRNNIKSFFTTIKDVFLSVLDFAKEKFSMFWEKGKEWFGSMKKNFSSLKDKVVQFFKNPRESFGKMLTGVKEGISSGWKAMKGGITSMKEKGVGKTLKERFKSAKEGVVGGMKSIFGGDKTEEMAKEGKPSIAPAPRKKGILSRMGEGIGSIGKGIGSVGKGIGGFGKGIGTGLAGVARGVASFGNPRVFKGALGMAAVGAALVPFAGALMLLAQVPVSTILAGTVAIMGLGLTTMMLGKMTGSIIKGSLAIGIMSVAFGVMAAAMTLISDVPPATMFSALAVVAGVAAIATALGLIATTGVGAVAILAGAGLLAVIGAAFIPFTYALSLLENVNPDVLYAIGPALMSMLPGLIGMALISPLLPLVGAGMLMLGAGLALMSLVDADGLDAIGESLLKLSFPLALLALMSPLLGAAGWAIAGIGMGMIPLAIASNLVDKEGLEAFTMLIQTLAGSAAMIAVAALALGGMALGVIALATAIGVANGILAVSEGLGDVAAWLGFDPGPGIVGTVLTLAGVSDKLMVTANALNIIASALERIGTAMTSLNDSEMALETIDTLISLDATQMQTLQDVSIAMDRVMSANEKLKEEKQVQQIGGAVGQGTGAVNTIVNSSSVGGNSIVMPSPSGRNPDPSILFSGERYYSMVYR